MLRKLLLVILLASTALAAKKDTKPPDLSGTWQFDSAKSTGGRADWTPDTILVIRQFGNRVEIDRRAADVQFSSDAYIVDGKDRQAYKTRADEAYLNAHWEKNGMVVMVHHVLNSEIGDVAPVRDVDTWTLADQGKTLIHKASDGKTFVFHKQATAGKPAGKSQ